MTSVVGLVLRKIKTFRRMSAAQRREWLRLRLPTVTLALRALLVAPIYGPPAIVLVLVGIRFLPVRVGWRIFGELIDLPAQYFRAMDVGIIPRRTMVMLVPSGGVANDALAREWGTELRLVNNRMLATLLLPFTWLPVIGDGQRNLRGWRATGRAGQIFRGDNARLRSEVLYIEKHGNLKVLDLSESIETAGQAVMRKIGVAEGDWWVTLHARETGYHQDSNNARNNDIMSYLAAAEAIVERGGWVFRVGDPSMRPLPPMYHVIDYVHTDAFSDWMDLYLAARCRFMLGMAAGPCTLPVLYGRPIVCTNFVALDTMTWQKFTMVIPKLSWLEREQRFLSTSEVLASPPGVVFDPDMSLKHGITHVDNSPDEIKAVALEMLGLINGSIQRSDEDNRRQRQFEVLWSPAFPAELWRGDNILGREFARKHPFVLQ